MAGMKQALTSILFCIAPLLAHAAEDTAPVRFLPIDRSGRPSVKITTPVVAAAPARMRSDSAAMNNGFFRIDRSMTTPQPLQHALVITPQVNANISGSDDPRIIRGPVQTAPAEADNAPLSSATPVGNNPILSLFNNNSNGHVPTFRDALLGRGAGALATAPLAAAQPTAAGKHLWPIPVSATQQISSGFGPRADPLNHNPKFHGGMDIAAATGTPVLATDSGTVMKVGVDGAYGKSITILNNDGSESKYGHLNSQSVKIGQRVNAGDVIGAVGATGRVTGPHLDYRISQNGVNLDPLKILTLPGGVPVDADESVHVSPVQTAATRPLLNAKQERLIVVR